MMALTYTGEYRVIQGFKCGLPGRKQGFGGESGGGVGLGKKVRG